MATYAAVKVGGQGSGGAQDKASGMFWRHGAQDKASGMFWRPFLYCTLNWNGLSRKIKWVSQEKVFRQLKAAWFCVDGQICTFKVVSPLFNSPNGKTLFFRCVHLHLHLVRCVMTALGTPQTPGSIGLLPFCRWLNGAYKSAKWGDKLGIPPNKAKKSDPPKRAMFPQSPSITPCSVLSP